ncbi:hypothetical protein ASPWEDRAFT_166130 [Aspergillus wentii DTO 134E9]|uniref:Uncharacterized protein n=1 Tax=Aspergillus wentii DTO 134E9 TaxID=1073089 RepID=A0A1L9RYR9_ASPWE|nr:uncharacterized protein ASPWEDRAFT_166130 [Aspergillus wentii DTO 134E9]KAI9932476.1 hypothetical protein MW887_008717 [Aspergillus wentii]OJJ40043.1 hypothetical protein ASPWEDRAFT_166130 [Aspergillus wentii DTO 134E9]
MAYSDQKPLWKEENQVPPSLLSPRQNRRLKRSLHALYTLAFLVILLLIGFVYLTVQLGKDRDLALHLQEQIQAYEQHGTNPLTKRFLPWYLAAAFWTTNQVFAFWGLANSCSGFNENNTNKAFCIWGAISTTVTFIGAYKNGATITKAIKEHWANNAFNTGWKRDEVISEVEAGLTQAFGLPVSFDGHMRHDHPKLSLLGLEEGMLWPVFHMYNHHNTSMHVTVTGYHDTHSVMSMGFGPKSNKTAVQKRDSYENDYFTSGGIDFTDCWNTDQNHEALNTGSDFDQVDKDVQCYFPDLSTTWGTQIQLYDTNVGGTIGAGSIAPFRGSDHASSISVMPGCPAGITGSSACRRAS